MVFFLMILATHILEPLLPMLYWNHPVNINSPHILLERICKSALTDAKGNVASLASISPQKSSVQMGG